ncbi:hypothetical protein LCGC14_1751240 [marine sediment metagenome]|uniref:Uncharacterized protein n=1 Tax=marine sediment metagenome TaxID=412755 RepID=A0A0F9H3W3_9ZZZZ
MIRSCKDIKSMDDFQEFATCKDRTVEMGLFETARILRWNALFVMSPDLFDRLFEERLRETKLRLDND